MKFSVRVNNDLPFAELLALAAAAERAVFDQVRFSSVMPEYKSWSDCFASDATP